MSSFNDLRAIAVDAAKRAGVRLVYAPDWDNPAHRADGAWAPDTAFLVHHLAGTGDGAVAWVQGRSYEFSPIPAIQYVARRDGSLILNYGEKCYHAGGGGPQVLAGRSIQRDAGNAYFVGVEIESEGKRQVISATDRGGITPAQVNTVGHLTAAWCRHYGRPASAVENHKDWAPDRKIDTLWPKGFWQQQTLARLGGAVAKPPAKPAAIAAASLFPIGDVDMVFLDPQLGYIWVVDRTYKRLSKADAILWAKRNGQKGKIDKLPHTWVERNLKAVA